MTGPEPLIQGVPTHDRDSVPAPFESVYLEYGRVVHRYCLSRLLDPGLAEEVAAQALAQAFAAYQRTGPRPEATRGWLLRIARNAVNDQLRRQRRHRHLLTALYRARPDPPDPEREALVSRQLSLVLAAMRELSERDRELIALRAAAGLRYEEIGEQLGISENTATVATRRAIARLRSRVGEQL
ncbi:MAG: RNA polymerase sigma factor [Candidatus Dormibacteria bacterium]